MKKVNVGMLAEGLTFTLLSAVLFLLSITGAYMYYVTPRTLPYLYFTSGVLLLLGVYALCRLFDRAHVKQYSHLIIVLVPLLLIVWSANDTGIVARLAQSAPSNQVQAYAPVGGSAYTMKSFAYEGTVLNGYDGENRSLVIPEEETYHWLVEIYENPEHFAGFTITTMGQVLKDTEYFEEGTFSPIREVMSCCAADLFPVGFMCEYGDVDSLQMQEWVSVTGRLELRSFEEYSELRIVVQSVTPTAPAREPYLFAY